MVPWLGNSPFYPYVSGWLHWHWGKSYDCPNAGETAVKYMAKYYTFLHKNITTRKPSANSVHTLGGNYQYFIHVQKHSESTLFATEMAIHGNTFILLAFVYCHKQSQQRTTDTLQTIDLRINYYWNICDDDTIAIYKIIIFHVQVLGDIKSILIHIFA